MKELRIEVKGKTELKKEMLKICLKTVENYQIDIVYDFEYIDNYEGVLCLCWFLRDTGTHLCETSDKNMVETYKMYNDVEYAIYCDVKSDNYKIVKVWERDDMM